MKTKGVLLLLLAVTGNACAQTNETLRFTNRFATFTDIRGRPYERVQLMTADSDAISYRTSDGGGRVYYTNLSAATLLSLGIPTNRIELSRRSAGLRRQQQVQAALQKQAGDAQERERYLNASNWIQIKIDVVDKVGISVHGGIRVSWITLESGARAKVYLRAVPIGVTSYYEQREQMARAVEQLRAQVKTQEAQLKQEEYQWRMADAAATAYANSYAPVYNIVMTERGRLNQWLVQLDNRQEQLVQLRKELADREKTLADLNAEEVGQTTVRAFVTRNSYNGLQILECSAP